jgi:hypothetical protein
MLCAVCGHASGHVATPTLVLQAWQFWGVIFVSLRATLLSAVLEVLQTARG